MRGMGDMRNMGDMSGMGDIGEMSRHSENVAPANEARRCAGLRDLRIKELPYPLIPGPCIYNSCGQNGLRL